MAAETVQTGATEEELLRLGAEDRLIEVINGEILEMTPVGFLHHIITGNIYRILERLVIEHRLGIVLMDGLIYILKRDKRGRVIKSRVPDTSFIRRGRVPKDFDLKRPFPGAPDLAVEVVSPDETAGAVIAKVRDYLEAGGEQVWVLYPDHKELHQYIHGDSTVHTFQSSGRFAPDILLPGLVISIGDRFTIPDFD
jgi:Uma2 family endonuclease